MRRIAPGRKIGGCLGAREGLQEAFRAHGSCRRPTDNLDFAGRPRVVSRGLALGNDATYNSSVLSHPDARKPCREDVCRLAPFRGEELHLLLSEGSNDYAWF